MKKLVLLTMACCCTLLAQAQCPTPVWADEFSGTSLDQSKWNYQIGDGCAEGICGWGNNELQSYQQANVTVANGLLKITAKRERIRGANYTSGRINTKGKGDWTYGRMEARIKLPAGGGLWPAFWMLPTNEVYGGWPKSGEIDIMEFVGHHPQEVLGTIHYGDAYPNNQYQGNKYVLHEGTFPEGYHTFAIEWEPGEIRWLLDGVLYSTKRTADLLPYQWPFDKDFHFLLNVAVGGNLGGAVDNTIFPATMEVDWVRVYDTYLPYLQGAREVAYQASGTSYTLKNLPANATVNWSVPAGATLVSGQGTPTITVDWGSSGGQLTATYSTGCGTQQLQMLVRVEPSYQRSFSFQNFDAPATIAFSSATGTLSTVSNPAPNGVNGSALVGKYIRNASQQYDVLAYTVQNISDASLYYTKEKKFYMDVYTAAPAGTQILLQLETSTATASNYPSGRHSRYVATTTNTNSWERLEFSPLDQPDASASNSGVTKLIMLFASNTFTGDTYYWDNFDSYDAQNDGGGGGGNLAPAVSISSPASGSTFTSLNPIAITASASDADGSISKVDFYVGAQLLSTDTSAPYEASFTPPGNGTYTLTAVATDNEGASTSSAGVSITVQTSTKGGGKPKRLSGEVAYFPNPLKGELSIRLDDGQASGMVYILDTSGRRLATAPLEKGQAQLSVQQLPQGLYLLEIHTGQGIQVERVVK
ncbi:family 16 glycosylhydrolase [Cesiribacter andamanensis]|uniref:Beta-glucanase n=1 Tax=Cesiribacter andamanensis AMV16 TaxID=1279009 RepID=M7NQ41_9BACT|nr:family 16 glycosylhydrolase [Cesiribacter andamanensis]EMR03830.1 Beta-glucanase precursor [Cesiribacter andamanensis AMV16]